MNNELIPDIKERIQALNPAESFIVQAPAGSGKTELLTQRFLALLSTVKQPEEILAITFTKKSAAEMRARIINALKKAHTEAEPALAHAKATWKLAQKVLQRNQQLSWHLLENPNRLRIQTIDSFNAYLTKQLPILSHFGAPPDLTDDPQALYQEAVQEFLSHLEENVDWSDAIAQLLLHMDNDLNKAETLLINLLAKRDQWLPYITLNANEPYLKEKLEEQLCAVVTEILEQVAASFPQEWGHELCVLANHAAYNLNAAQMAACLPTVLPAERRVNGAAEVRIIACIDLQELPGTEISDLEIWLGIKELLLTKDDDPQWRKAFNKKLGFLAPSDARNAEEKQALTDIKQRMSVLIEQLSKHESLRLAFKELGLAPTHFYHETQWEMLEALHQVLRIVVAQLTLVFQKHGCIDYIESAQAALAALGTEDAPTDMTLALDYQLQHILIDEFQDTSHSQFRLIEKLTTGWTQQDGRTLFVVGDPMQSIYRFREAEVGLFIQVRNQGLGSLKLKPLTLSVNFRSNAGIVNWVNQTFQQVFPKQENIATGAVSYNASIAHQMSQDTHSAVNLQLFDNSGTEAARIVDLIQQIKTAHSTDTIAILVRSRSHLSDVIPALKKANLAYQAIDIDPLNTRPVIQDLLALTRALLHVGDRIAWLSVLRAPWCGLTLDDLLILSGNQANKSIYEQMQSPTVVEQLSADGQQRLLRILPLLKQKVMERYRYSLRVWIENTWLLLGGPACVANIIDLDDATAFFNLLESLEQSGNPLNIDELTQKVSQLFAVPNHQADQSLQIMTIHNAKGLEFDTVILPQLNRSSPHDDRQLLLWMERPLQNQHHALLMAPVNAIGQETDAIYEYIKRQHAIKTDHEIGRLLYVAATRAKKRLYLSFVLPEEEIARLPAAYPRNPENSADGAAGRRASPAKNSMLEKLWPALANQIPPMTRSAKTDLQIEQNKNMISRLTLNWKNPVTEDNTPSPFHNETSGFLLPDHHPKLIGILIHQLLQQMGEHGRSWWEMKSNSLKKAYIKNALQQLGMLAAALDDSVALVFTAIANTLADTRGQWILKKHTFAQSELQLSALLDNKVQSLVIDRTFIDETGYRWIIDYKTATTDKNIAIFLQEEQKKYSEQLLNYAEALCKIDARPIKLGLYFPLIPAWCEWNFMD